MNFWTFAEANPWQVFFFGFFLLCMLAMFVELSFRMWVRFMRMLAIRKAGWPPAHCDADGDGVE